MRTYKYIGLFKSDTGHEYTMEVNCMSFIQSFFLLTAKAIESGQHYQLSTITDENGIVAEIGDIMKVSELFS